ncbi:MAG: hypothetical protein CMF50_10045 [Legionellales bacterium]|nr:hypothetical protein [Legionellales bacterium]|tara:strand:+ start:28350 stop:28868 length:519 start_codon:yes stop_codon:yes gene_type:complete
MKQAEAINVLNQWDKQGHYVFLKRDLRKLFPDDTSKAFSEALTRLVAKGHLKRACKNVYVYPSAKSFDSYTIERIAIALRRGEYNYVSLESMLSEYGVISQVPMRLTVMTTGRRGVFYTPYGVIEFTHTKRSIMNILDNTLKLDNRPLRIATESAAIRDLNRVGRNTDLLHQ